MKHTQKYEWRKNSVLLNHFIRIIKILIKNKVNVNDDIDKKLSEYYQIGYRVDETVSIIEDINEYVNVFLIQYKINKNIEFNIKDYMKEKYKRENHQIVQIENSPHTFYAFKSLKISY